MHSPAILIMVLICKRTPIAVLKLTGIIKIVARGRMSASKGAILSLLLDAYQKRNKVAMISFRKTEAVVNLPVTSSIKLAATYLSQMPVGGRTPLSAGLEKAYQMIKEACPGSGQKDPNSLNGKRLETEQSGIRVIELPVRATEDRVVGTMNPEEGELRPQLLDRFGLCVNIGGIIEVEERVSVMERRTRFDEDPEGFAAQWETESRNLSQRIEKAMALYPDVIIPREGAGFQD